MRIRLADYVADFLVSHGVRCVFCSRWRSYAP